MYSCVPGVLDIRSGRPKFISCQLKLGLSIFDDVALYI